MVGCVPHTGQLGFLRSFSSRNFIPRASKSSKRPMRLSPRPRISLMVSIAWMEPTIPGRTPRTPPSAQQGTRPGGGFRIEAAVARTIGHSENGGLPFESEDRAVDVGLSQEDAGIVDEIARGKIVGAIDDDVEVFEKFESVGASQLRFERLDLNVRVQV